MKTCKHCKTEYETVCPKCFKVFQNVMNVVPIHKIDNKTEESKNGEV